jgi:hypothetical protein
MARSYKSGYLHGIEAKTSMWQCEEYIEAVTQTTVHLDRLSTIMKNKLLRQYRCGYINEGGYGKRYQLTETLNSYFGIHTMPRIYSAHAYFGKHNKEFVSWIQLMSLLAPIDVRTNIYYQTGVAIEIKKGTPENERIETMDTIIDGARKQGMLVHGEKAKAIINAIETGEILSITQELK